ncbi:hypothetical protein DR62_06710 [Burkholderia thailandensis]|nr:hypothetical protein DR62_06710 [Burkholderia thailandensis]AOI51905.1 hypothetical protein WI24_08880 [Burkholderia thailandensis]
MAVLGTVVGACSRFDEDVLRAHQRRDFSFRRAVTAQLIGDDLLRCVKTGSEHALEEAFRGRLATSLLQQDVEFDAVLIGRSPEDIRFALQCHKHLVQMPRTAPAGSGQP